MARPCRLGSRNVGQRLKVSTSREGYSFALGCFRNSSMGERTLSFVRVEGICSRAREAGNLLISRAGAKCRRSGVYRCVGRDAIRNGGDPGVVTWGTSVGAAVCWFHSSPSRSALRLRADPSIPRSVYREYESAVEGCVPTGPGF